MVVLDPAVCPLLDFSASHQPIKQPAVLTVQSTARAEMAAASASFRAAYLEGHTRYRRAGLVTVSSSVCSGLSTSYCQCGASISRYALHRYCVTVSMESKD